MRIKIVLLYRWVIIFLRSIARSSLLQFDLLFHPLFVLSSLLKKSQTPCIIFLSLFSLSFSTQGLKSFQGEMWKAGYASGELVGHLYSDFVPMMNWCTTNNVKVCIYSSGSINAQKLLFSHTSMGDMTPYICDYFDTTSGSKREADSYSTIAKALGVTTKDVIFVSDIEDEIIAAKQAGMKAVVAVRPGNAPLCAETKLNFPVVRSLLQLCGAD
jgi:2,3-diketo-5-methylthio-1-phosphopentane phosphatase